MDQMPTDQILKAGKGDGDDDEVVVVAVVVVVVVVVVVYCSSTKPGQRSGGGGVVGDVFQSKGDEGVIILYLYKSRSKM